MYLDYVFSLAGFVIAVFIVKIQRYAQFHVMEDHGKDSSVRK